MLRELPREQEVIRYRVSDRVAHWWVAGTFIYLMLSGLALGYPRATWLYDILGGGQTVRFMHPWAGVAFTLVGDASPQLGILDLQEGFDQSQAF